LVSSLKKYQIIYADPPWRYNDKRVSITSDRPQKYGGITYPTMTIEELRKLPINQLADENCVLFLWVTMPLLEDCFPIFKDWGFSFRTCGFVWVKRNKNNDGFRSGLGSYTNCNAELCLIGVKGKCLERKRKDIKQIVFEPVQLHSRKPMEVARRIELLYGDLPRIELFARQKTEGWDVWGNEVESDIELLGDGQ
jgi:site-specific DNA-methyltransferase (adenine-specific)